MIQCQDPLPFSHRFKLHLNTTCWGDQRSVRSYEAQILQNGDVPVSDTDTSRVLSDTYPRSIRTKYFNF